jgi:hypothetical protein
MGTTSTGDRGHHAEKPAQIPMKGWKDIGLRVKDQLNESCTNSFSRNCILFFSCNFPDYCSCSIYIWTGNGAGRGKAADEPTCRCPS